MALRLAGIGSPEEKIGQLSQENVSSSANTVSFRANVTGYSGIVTGDSGRSRKIGHLQSESAVTFGRNNRSRSNGISGQIGAEYALQKQIAPLKSDRLEHHALIHRLKFEEVISKAADMARVEREKAEAELAELQSRVMPLQEEINQLTRQFWVTKDQVKASKYDLSATRYRLVEQDEEFYEQPHITLERLKKLEAVTASQIAALEECRNG